MRCLSVEAPAKKGGFIPRYPSRLTRSLRCSLIALPIKNRQSGMARKNTPWPCWHGKLLQEFRFGASPARWYGAVRRDRDVSGAPPKAEPTEADLLLHVEMAKEDFRGKPQRGGQPRGWSAVLGPKFQGPAKPGVGMGIGSLARTPLAGSSNGDSRVRRLAL